MKKASILIIIVSILSKILGFVRETVLAATYGAGNVSDAFIFAYGIPSTLFSVIAAAFVTGFIPMFSRVEAEGGEEESGRFMNNILHVMLLFCVVIVSVFLLIPEPILGLLLPNATPALMEYVIPFTQITVFSVFLTCIIQLCTGFLQLRNYFVFPMLMGFPMNIVVILTIMISRNMGTWILPYGILISYTLQATFILAFSIKKGFRYKPTLDFKDPNLRRMLFLAIPLIIGSSSSTIGDLINKAIVSGIEGGVSYINYATRLGGILQSVFGTAIISVAYPSLSRSIARNDVNETYKNFGDAFVSICLLIAPASIGLIVLAKPIVQVVYMRGEFTQADLVITVPVFIGYTVGLLALSLRDLLTRMFYSYQDMRTPMWNSIITSAFQALMAVLLFRMTGIVGVTWAMSAATLLGLLRLAIILRKRLKGFPMRHYFSETVKIILSAVLMGAAAFIVFKLALAAGLVTLISLVLAMGTGVLVYGGLIILLRIEPAMDLVNIVKRKMKR